MFIDQTSQRKAESYRATSRESRGDSSQHGLSHLKTLDRSLALLTKVATQKNRTNLIKGGVEVFPVESMVTTSRFQEHFNTDLFATYHKSEPLQISPSRVSSETNPDTLCSSKSNKHCTLKRESRVKPRNRVHSLCEQESASSYVHPSHRWLSWLVKLRIRKE
ncbi:hypothetical protein BY458DRAFT_489977 [Sporodiniella umbellata]|nr:hypothetical protein BY458DRAFT_489977 [Sporodiniella umbellata]